VLLWNVKSLTSAWNFLKISRPDNIAEAFTLEERIKSYGVEIIKVDSPWLDESTDEGHLFKTIQYAVAGYERKKIAKRASNWKINRIKSGYRPFPQPPVGYIRKRDWVKNYNDVIDQSKWPILQEGLELFANNVIQTQADLWRFRDKKWLRTNRKGATTLQRTFPEKVLQLHRLFYYAWYIFYPTANRPR